MDNYIYLPNISGISVYNKNYQVQCYVNKKGQTLLCSRRASFLLDFGNVFFLRGLKYFIFSLMFFLKNLTTGNLNSPKKQKLKFLVFGICVLFLFLTEIICFKFACTKIALTIVSFFKSRIGFDFVVLVVRIVFIYLLFLLLLLNGKYRQFCRFNACCNLLENNKIHNPLNFINYLLFVVVFDIIISSIITLDISSFLVFIFNCLIFVFCCGLCFEILLLLQKNNLQQICVLTSCLCCLKPQKAEILMSKCAKLEAEFLQNKQRREMLEEVKLEDSFVKLYLECKQKIANYKNISISDLDFIFCEVLNVKRSSLRLQNVVSFEQSLNVKNALEKRIAGQPLSKIFGKQNFYGYDFLVTDDVLTPRMDTEILIEKVIEKNDITLDTKILDLCSGSGVIGIVLGLETSCRDITCVDISSKAIAVAQKNAKKHNVDIKFLQSNLFEGLKKNNKFDIIVSNPPYILSKQVEVLEEEVIKYDPKIALDGGEDGLYFYKKIVNDSVKFLSKKGCLAFEIGIGQCGDVCDLLQKDFENICVFNDYNNIERVIIAQKK